MPHVMLPVTAMFNLPSLPQYCVQCAHKPVLLDKCILGLAWYAVQIWLVRSVQTASKLRQKLCQSGKMLSSAIRSVCQRLRMSSTDIAMGFSAIL